MRLSYFLNPEHPAGSNLTTRLNEHLEQVQLARDAGFDGVFIGHHLSYEGAVWLPPLPTLARVAAVSGDMELGTCMLLAPLFHPVHLAEQGAMLDIITGGRFTLGVAPGWSRAESEILGLTHNRRFSRFRECVDIVQRLWQGESLSFAGQHFTLREQSLKLLPIRKPRPPMFFGGSVEAAIQRVATLANPDCGDSWVASSHVKNERIAIQARTYRDALDRQGKTTRSPMPVLRNIVVAPSRKQALKDAGPYLAASYQAFGQQGLFREVIGNENDQFDLGRLTAGRVILGSPEEVADQLLTLQESLPYERLITRVQWMGMEQRLVLRSIDLLAERVLPALN